MNRRGIRLFAADYPHDYPEVEATVLVFRHGLRHGRGARRDARSAQSGRSSITAFRSLYYMGKVSLALFVGLLRPRPVAVIEGRLTFVAAVAVVVVLAVIIELIRRHRLQERYALLWIVTGGVMLVFALWRSALDRFAELVGVAYPPSALFMVAGLFVLVVLLHYSTVLSKLSEQNKTLAQQIALLEQRLRERRRAAPPPRRLRLSNSRVARVAAVAGPILVTGAEGFVGQPLAGRARRAGGCAARR